MKDKILELMRSPVPDAYALGFELCAVHYPEWLILIDYIMANGGVLDDEHINYNQYAKQFFAEHANIGDYVPCDKWAIDIVKTKNFSSAENECYEIIKIRVLDENETLIAVTDDCLHIEIQLEMIGWQ